MTRDETYSALRILQAAYPNFYRGMKKPQAEDVINLWSTMFSGEDVSLVQYALYQLIETHNGYPPTIADVKAKIKELVSVATGEPTDEELWVTLRQAICNGLYGSESVFNALPPLLQRYVGTPYRLHDMASGDISTLDTVVHGQFLKQIPVLRKRQEYERDMPPMLMDAIRHSVGLLDGGGIITLEEENDRRNEILDLLETGKPNTERTQ